MPQIQLEDYGDNTVSSRHIDNLCDKIHDMIRRTGCLYGDIVICATTMQYLCLLKNKNGLGCIYTTHDSKLAIMGLKIIIDDCPIHSILIIQESQT